MNVIDMSTGRASDDLVNRVTQEKKEDREMNSVRRPIHFMGVLMGESRIARPSIGLGKTRPM